MRKSYKLGILQALFVLGYISLVGLVLFNAEKIFGKMNSLVGPITFLTMFSVSALICGLLVFYKPYKLFFDGKKNEAVEVVLATAISLFVILLALFGVMLILK